MDKVWEAFCEQSDIDPEIYLIFTKNKASWIELQRDLSVSDVYDLLEIIDIESSLEKAANMDEESRQRQQNRR